MGPKKEDTILLCQPTAEVINDEPDSPKKLTRVYLFVSAIFLLLFLAVYFLWFTSIVYALEKIQFVVVQNNPANNNCSYTQPKMTIQIYGTEEDILANSPACYDVPEMEKFDCFPEPNSNEQDCYKRGCCWLGGLDSDTSFLKTNETNSTKPLNVPYCFYPFNYNGYQMISTKYTPYGINLHLKRVTPSGFPKDIEEIVVNCTFLNNEQLRIKIFDARQKRYEVFVPNFENYPKGNIGARNYRVDTDQRSIWITRLSTGKVIFSVKLSQLIYANQMIQISIKLPSHNVYGIGDTKSPLLKSTNWTRYVLFARDRIPEPNLNLYSSHPFYLIMEDTPSEITGNSHGVLMLNSNAMEVILQPTPALTFRTIGGIIDLIVNTGPSPSQVIEQYTKMVGRSFMPPYWSLGFHLCRLGYISLNKTKETMERTKRAGIPQDTQWNDYDYMLNRNDFTLDPINFGELPEFVSQLHQNGMHYMILIDPGISGGEKPGTYPPFEEGVQMDIFIKNATGQILFAKTWNKISTVFPDFTNPQTIRYWTKQFKNFHQKIPFDGAWIDMNEPSNFIDGSFQGCPPDNELDHPPYIPGNIEPLYTKTICMSAKQYASDHYNIHNVYGMTESIATNIALTDIREKRPFIISRSTFPGHGHYGGVWDGDVVSNYDHMRWTISSILSLNMYGISMAGADICGFNGNTTVELCARWSALGSFYPFSRNHNTDDSIEQDPASLGPDVIAAAKSNLEIRYFLLPYLYTLFYHSHTEGQTVARALFMEFPTDKKTYGIDTQFLLGDSVMLVPVLEQGKIEVIGYLPAGLWYDLQIGTIYASKGEEYTFETPIHAMNVLLRGGKIIPGQEHGLTTTVSRKKRFTILVLPDEMGRASGDLFWDDGDSIDTYEQGVYNLVQFSASKNAFSSQWVNRGYETEMILGTVVVYGLNIEPSNVTLNGNVSKFFYNKDAQILHCLDLNVTLLENMILVWN